MNIGLFSKIGLGNIDISYIFIGIIVVLIASLIFNIISMVKINKLSSKYRKFMTGKNVKSLEKEIFELFDDNKEMKEQIETNRKDIKSNTKNLRSVYQKSAIVRYDAFREMGGKLSFCLVMLTQENDGFILNSVHSSAGCYSYIKEIKGGRCAIDLGTEEQNALDIALGDKDFL